MRILGQPLGVQSWCFRAFTTTDAVIGALRACDLDAIELCGVHLKMDGMAAATLRRYTDQRITVTSYGINRFANDENAVRPLFEFAQRAGIRALGADPDPDAFELLQKLCAEYGVKLAIHNHGRTHRYGTVEQLEAVFNATSADIGLCLDTAWILDAGGDPIAAIERFADRLYGIHIKDFVFNDGKPEDVVIGTGNLNLPALMATLEKVNFTGYLTLEYEGDVDNPIPSVNACITQLRDVTSAHTAG